jgi:hypothetical protein
VGQQGSPITHYTTTSQYQIFNLSYVLVASHLSTLLFFNYFAKLYDSLKIFQIWQPTVVRHTTAAMGHDGSTSNRRDPRL